MLTSDEMLVFLRKHKEELGTRFSVKTIGLFASAMRGTLGQESDVDILVELAHPTFDHYMDLKFFLEEPLGRRVDLFLADSRSPASSPSLPARWPIT